MIVVAGRRYQNDVEFHTKDMKDIDFYNEFDAVISLFGSINYLKDDSDIELLLWNIWRAMKSDGCGLIELWNSVPIRKIKEKKISPVSTTVYEDTTITPRKGFYTPG